MYLVHRLEKFIKYKITLIINNQRHKFINKKDCIFKVFLLFMKSIQIYNESLILTIY